jgi:peptide-methionine (S)-S-oxide reductase
MNKKANFQVATFGSGCFWCTEAIFDLIDGVIEVVSGYAGGETVNPTYESVCSGKTGHAEVVQIKFDPKVISYSQLLHVFWTTHDPTTLNRQGADIGTQYRSVIFYHDEEQRTIAEEMKRFYDDSRTWKAPIVTEINPFTSFYAAEEYHQDYYRNNSSQPYCSFVIKPKIEKAKRVFEDYLERQS